MPRIFNVSARQDHHESKSLPYNHLLYIHASGVSMKRAITFLLFLFLVLPAVAKKHKKSGGEKAGGKFDYYLLSLSWAPNYCAGHPTDHSSECKTGGHTAFVLHGLWPQAGSGAPPMACAPARPVAKATVDRMLHYMPTRGLIQHEWEKHGTCSGLSADGYFAQVEQAFKSVKVPEQYSKLDQARKFDIKSLEQDFAAANNAPADAFRVSCHSKELVALEVCLTKDLKYQACTKSVQECPAGPVLMRPPK
jgi:ribonuclease T2